jgi:hypothetical protein
MCVEQVCAFLDDDAAPSEIDAALASLFGRSSTFRKGQIGSWRDAFDDELERLFWSVAQDVLIRWGYGD